MWKRNGYWRVVRVCWMFGFLLLVQVCSEAELPDDNGTKPKEEEDDEVIVEELNTTILGKVIAGYQGWFNAEGDGADLGWKHYQLDGKFEPGTCSIDYWPDMSEMGDDEKYATSFEHEDGSTAYVFSSANAATVSRHFQWMKEYGIDGVFVQKFITTMKNARKYENQTKVFDHAYQAAKANGRNIGVMYDLSGSTGEDLALLIDDWNSMLNAYNFRDENNGHYLTYKRKPVVAIWGVGFKDREYTIPEVYEVVKALKNGGFSVLLGVPTYWREQTNDCIDDPAFHPLLEMVDIIHPWMVGRISNLQAADNFKERYVADKAWCESRDLKYMPVVFPGFSWHNLKRGEAPTAGIPRLKGEFYWRQMYNTIDAGSEMIYVAMFDEMDEGTCIFKCTNDPPVGASPFVTYEGLPSDYYLWLTGKAGEMLREEIPLSFEQPQYPD